MINKLAFYEAWKSRHRCRILTAQSEQVNERQTAETRTEDRIAKAFALGQH